MSDELVDKIERLFAEQMVIPPPETEPEPIKRWARLERVDDITIVANVLVATDTGAEQLRGVGAVLIELATDSRVQAGDIFYRENGEFSRPELPQNATDGLSITVAGPDGPVEITLPADAVSKLADALRAQLGTEK